MAIIASQLVGKVEIQGIDQAKQGLLSVGSTQDMLSRKFATAKPFDLGKSITAENIAQAKLNQLELQVQRARERLQTLQGAANAGDSIRNVSDAQAKLTLLESDVTKAREKLQTLKDAADAGQSVQGIPEAEAKLTLLENKAAQARERLQTIQDSANAGQAVQGVPEAQARLAILEARAGQAREKLASIQSGAQEADGGIEQVSNGSLRLDASLRQMISEAGSAGSALASNLGGGIKGAISGMLDFGSKISMITMGIQNLYQGAISLGTAFLKPNADMEQTKVAFVQLLGSSQAADKELRELSQFAAQTPFQFPDLAESVQKLLAFQFDLKDTKPLLTAIGDALSGLGKNTPATLQQVVDVFGQMHASGHIMTQDLMQLTSVGINGFQLLADGMHKSVPEIQKMVSNGLIPANQGIEILRQGMEKTFGGGMQAQSRTFTGLLSTFQDNIGQAWRAFTGPLFDKAKDALTTMGNLVSSDKFQAFATGAGKAVGDIITTISRDVGNVVTGFERFGASLDKVSQNGAVANFVHLSQELGRLFSIVGDKGKDVFTQLFQSLSGGASPTENANTMIRHLGDAFWNMGEAVRHVSDFLSHLDVKGFVQGFTQAGQSLDKEFGPSLANIGRLMAGDLGRQLRDMGQLAQELGRWFNTSVVPALKQAEPSFDKLAHVMADTVVPAGFKIRGMIMDLVEHAFKTFGPILEDLVPKLIVFAGIVGGALADGLKFVMPYILQAAKAIGDFAKDIMTRIAPIIKQWIDQMTKDFDAFQKVFAIIWPYLSQILKGVWDEIVGVVKIAWALVSGIIKIGLDLLSGNWKQAWQDFKDMLSGVWDGIKTYLKGAWEIIKGIFSGAWDGIKAIWAPVGNWFKDRWKSIQDAFGSVGAWFHDRFSEGHDGATNAWGNIGQWFNDRWKDIQGIFANVGKWFGDKFAEVNAPFKGLEDFIGGVFQTIWNIITRVVGLIAGIVSEKWKEISETAKIYWAALQVYIDYYLALINQKIHEFIDPLVKMLSDKWNEISKNAQDIWHGVQQRIADVWNGISTNVNDKVNWVKNTLNDRWNDIKNGVSSAWKWISDQVSSRWNDISKTISDKANVIKDNVLRPFNQARDAIGGVVKGFANNMIDQFNNGLASVEGFLNGFGKGLNDVAKALGAQPAVPKATIPRLQHYATGTPTAGHPQDSFAVVGEEGREVVWLPKGAHVIPHGMSEMLLKQGFLPGYADGTPGVDQIVSWIGGGAQGILNNMISAFHITPPSLPGHLNDMAGAIFGKMKEWALSYIDKIMPHFDFGGGGSSGGGDFGGQVSGNLASWIAQAIALTHVPGSWAGALATIAMHESGGNPSAVNDWDVNAQNGDPSRGLFQTIMATFRAYALPGHTNIFNGVDNAAAAIGYIKARYGDVFHVPGILSMASGGPYVGYADGGIIGEPIAGVGLRTGTKYAFGERGPEAVVPYMPAGTRAITSSGGAGAGIATPVHIHVTAEITMDGQRTARVLLPEIVTQIRNGAAITF